MPATSTRPPELLASSRTVSMRGSAFARGAAPFSLHAPAQRIHQVHHIVGLRRRCARRAAGPLGSDQCLERGLVAILELGWIELGLFGVQNVLGEFEGVPGNPGIWNIVEVI